MLKMIAEKTRKAELKELRKIIKETLDKEESQGILGGHLTWYQNIHPALKSGLVKCDYKIIFRVLTENSEALTEKINKWMSKQNKNRIWQDCSKSEWWKGCTRYEIRLEYNYKKA